MNHFARFFAGTILLFLLPYQLIHAQALSRQLLSPVHIVWKTPDSDSTILNASQLLKPGTGQAITNPRACILKSLGGQHPGILLDFGKEIQGGVQIITGNTGGRIHIRFGESVGEAMSDLGQKGSSNDHAVRDEIVVLPMLGKAEIGNTGFRFVRIDLVDDNVELPLKEVRAIFVHRNIPYLGSFQCSDPLLNRIWKVGAYTVQLNMQDYLWDGIKRDRLVWVGDMEPEVASIESVFGYNEVVPKTLDFARDNAPLPQCMNYTVSYSLWWILIQREWYWHYGRLDYLKKQADYLKPLLTLFCTMVDPVGKERLVGGDRFLDWPTRNNLPAIHAGLQGLLSLSLRAGAELSTALGDTATARLCTTSADLMKHYTADPEKNKQAAAILGLADLALPQKMDSIIIRGKTDSFSTYFGYYMLQAMAKAGDYHTALNIIRNYWGGMLKMGATTFWEDFDMSWMKNATPINRLPDDSTQKDIHGDFGAYSYPGFRKSLCHGWASGPTAWLTEHVLGITVVVPGCKVLKIEPHLEDLKYAEGTFPTPQGIVYVKFTKAADGKITSVIKAPKGVQIIR